MSDPISHPVLKLEGITKRYGGVTALANVDFACSLGTIHAVVGENGAGKSSLMKIIAGVIRPDSGQVCQSLIVPSYWIPGSAHSHAALAIWRNRARAGMVSRIGLVIVMLVGVFVLFGFGRRRDGLGLGNAPRRQKAGGGRSAD